MRLDGLPPTVPWLKVGAEGRDADGRTYRLVATLVRGGMGELYVAETQPAPPTHAVVKRLLPELADQGDYIKMFESEARVMRRLDHPHIVRVLGMPEFDDVPCLALEFVDGRSAHDLASRASRLRVATPPAVAAFVAARVADALDYVHGAVDDRGNSMQLVHRDVSPGNVLIGFDGTVKLTDFGIAKSRLSSVSTTVGIVKGKARYLAPEQILGQAASPRSDVFSLALVLVEILTGEPLFERGSIPKTLFAVVHGERPSMTELLPTAAQPLAGVLEHALATDPNTRLQSAAEFRRGLELVADLLGPPMDAAAVGAHLRGLFAGTEGPLTRAGGTQAPSSRSPSGRALPAPIGGAPLDPAAFETRPPAPNPLIDPEPRPPPSAPQEVDHGLSAMAWLQATRGEIAFDEARTTLAVPPPRRARRRRWVDWVIGAAIGATAAGPLGFLGGRFAADQAPAAEAPGPPEARPASEPHPPETAAPEPAAPEPVAPPDPPPGDPTHTAGKGSEPGPERDRLDEAATESDPKAAAPPETERSSELEGGPDRPNGEAEGTPRPDDDGEGAPPEPPPAPGWLEVIGPRRALVRVDGEPVGRAPLELEVAAGVHAITIQPPGRRRRHRRYELVIEPEVTVRIGSGVQRLR